MLTLHLESRDVIRLLNAPMAEWERRLARMGDAQRQELEDAAVAVAVRCGRLAAYTAATSARENHALAVRRQNKVAAALRRLFGFTSPVSDITF